jgi:catechol 2,3-dioxygenase-like lactoylglutathione lyase family enzyme
MKTRRFDHIDLGVREMAAAKRFYAQVLLLPGDATGLRSPALLRDISE